MRPRDLALLLLLGAMWGTAFVFITLGLRSFSPVFLAAIRFDIVAVILAGAALTRARGPRLPRTGAQWAAVGIAAVLNVGAYHAFLFWGQQFTTPGVAAVVVGLNPVLTTAFSRALLPTERLGRGGLLGLVLGVAGVTVLASLKPGPLLDARGIGELAIVAAIASWALGSVLVKRSRHGLDVYAFIAWHSAVGAVLLHGASALFEGDGALAVFDREGVVALLYLAVVASGAGFILYFTLLERVGPIRLNLVSHIAAVFATLAGWAYLHDPVEPRAVGAFVLIAAGFALVARPHR